MRVRFLRDRDFTRPDNRRVTTAYKAGDEATFRREWGEALVARGDAVEIAARAPGGPDAGRG